MKKVFTLIMVLVLCTSLMAVTAFAAGGALSVGSASAQAGETVTVNVSIASNSGIAYIKLKPSYDTSALTLNSIKSSGGLSFNTAGATPNWYDPSGFNNTYTGGILTMEFTVKDGVKPDSYNVSISVVEAWDETENAVAFSGATGYVTVTCAHQYVAGTVTPPTCTEKGYTTYTCSKCGDSYTANEVAALGHAWDNGVVTTAATCTADGVKTFTCGNCGETKTEVIPALVHAYDAGVVTTAATCTADGVKTFTCGNCGDSYTEDIPALGHAYDAGVVTTAATCTADGVKTFTCGNCGETKTEDIPALGHTEGEAVVENKIDATCTVDGSYDEVVYCSVCGEELNRETKVVKAAHTPAKAVRENEVKGDCKTKHTYEEVVYCSVCKEEISRTKVTGELGGHNYVDGKCTICGAVKDTSLDNQPDTGDIFVEIALYASFAALAVGAVVYAKRKVRD